MNPPQPTHPDAVEQATRSGRAPVRLAARWLVGMGVMAWSYLREPVPIRRAEVLGGDDDLPPDVPEELIDDRSQPAEAGHGPLYHRRFRVTVDDARVGARELMTTVSGDLTRLLPGEVAAVSPRTESRTLPGPGDEFVVRMPGPWDGPVRVVLRDDSRLRLATLDGHLEAGQIEFRASDEAGGALLRDRDVGPAGNVAGPRALRRPARGQGDAALHVGAGLRRRRRSSPGGGSTTASTS